MSVLAALGVIVLALGAGFAVMAVLHIAVRWVERRRERMPIDSCEEWMYCPFSDEWVEVD